MPVSILDNIYSLFDIFSNFKLDKIECLLDIKALEMMFICVIREDVA